MQAMDFGKQFRIKLEGDLSEDQRQRLLEIADRCPVHRTLHGEVKVRTSLVDSRQRRTSAPMARKKA